MLLSVVGKKIQTYYSRRKSLSLYGGQPAHEQKFGASDCIVIKPKAPGITGSTYTKENWVVENKNDPDHFKHLFSLFYHRENLKKKRAEFNARNLSLPVLVPLPGIICNMNLFRVDVSGKDFIKDIDNARSFTNRLAEAGYPVALVNPRDNKWIYTRFVENRLGITNYFSDAVGFVRLAQDIDFFIDVACGITNSKKAVVIGFSLGGMELLYRLASGPAPSNLAAAIPIGVPEVFTSEQYILFLFSLYNWMAKYAPFKDYHLLKILGRNLSYLKPVLKRVPASILKKIENNRFLRQIYNPENTNIEAFSSVLRWALEPTTTPVINYFESLASSERFIAGRDKTDVIASLANVDTPCQFIHGGKDLLAPHELCQEGYDNWGRNRESVYKEMVYLDDPGHIDLIMGLKFHETADAILRFIETIKNLGYLS